MIPAPVPCLDDVFLEEGDAIVDTSGQIFSVEFYEKVHERVDQSMRRSIIVCLFGRRIGYKTLLDFINLLWKPKGKFQVVDLDSDYYIVIFKNEEDYVHVLTDGPWTVYGSYLTVIVWVRIPKLPYRYYSKALFICIANAIGKVIKIDYKTLARDRGHFTRLAIVVNMNKHLIPTIRIDGVVQQLEYEGLQQSFCKCGTYVS
ncbi:uncharacterized protein LOC120152808 [Hibiscus syriacus]|uniref:uncharacterized protein LOC120152808 n=1 Tax=Hibiscus syriacus TaxID=106335 RepID=UPI00192440FD|nr:uncharacterized protein LOC120152808 [Hibiscus syriacus]